MHMYVRAFKLQRIPLKWEHYKIDEILINIKSR